MKKIFVLFCLTLVSCVFFTSSGGQAVFEDESSVKVYFADRKLYRLIPTNFDTSSSSPEKIAREIVKYIVAGKDHNPEILRIIPNEKNMVTVLVKNDTAYINLSGKLKTCVTKNAETERLLVYQLVNSITSIPQIEFARFTIDGKTQKDFLGFLDMREIFKPDYSI